MQLIYQKANQVKTVERKKTFLNYIFSKFTVFIISAYFILLLVLFV